MSDAYEDIPTAAYTRHQRADLMLTTLKGLIEGITADRVLNHIEIGHLTGWMERHADFGMSGPPGELFTHVTNALEDGVLTSAEQDELIHFIEKIRGPTYYARLTAGLQELEALVSAIAIDRSINVDEMRSLRSWLQDHEELKTHWPYDEIDTLVTMVMADGRIDPDEHRQLLSYFGAFATDGTSLRSVPQDITSGEMLYSTDPEIIFEQRIFCITGASKRTTRRGVCACIERVGGLYQDKVTKDLHYLIVCDGGNPAWAYSSYGRKLESAITYRREGVPIVVVRENDLWDGLADLGIELAAHRQKSRKKV